MALPPVRKYQTLRSSVQLPAGSRLGFKPGRGFYAAPKTVTPKAVKPGVVKPPPPITGMAGLYGGIGPNAYVNNLYAPQETQLASQQAARMAGYQQLVKEFAASLATLGQGLAPYEAAAQSQTGTAAAGAAGLAGSNPNAAAQADLAAIGAPASQQAQVAAHNQAVFGGGAGVLNYTGGTIPADIFRQDAAGRAAYLAALPAIGQSSALQGLTQLNALASQDTSRLGAAKAQALQQAHSALADYVQKNQALKQNAAIAQAQFGLKVNDQTLRAQGQEFGQQATNARLGLQAQGLTLAQKKLQLAQTNADRSYNLAVAKLNRAQQPKVNAALSKALLMVVDSNANPILRNGKPIPIPQAPGTAKGKKPLGLSTKDYSKQTALALGAARNYHSEWTDANGVAQQPLTWQQYLTHGLNAGIDPRILVRQGRRVYNQREIRLGLIPGRK